MQGLHLCCMERARSHSFSSMEFLGRALEWLVPPQAQVRSSFRLPRSSQGEQTMSYSPHPSCHSLFCCSHLCWSAPKSAGGTWTHLMQIPALSQELDTSGLEALQSVVCSTGHRSDPPVLLKCSSTPKLMAIAGVTSPKMLFSLRS